MEHFLLVMAVVLLHELYLQAAVMEASLRLALVVCFGASPFIAAYKCRLLSLVENVNTESHLHTMAFVLPYYVENG